MSMKVGSKEYFDQRVRTFSKIKNGPNGIDDNALIKIKVKIGTFFRLPFRTHFTDKLANARQKLDAKLLVQKNLYDLNINNYKKEYADQLRKTAFSTFQNNEEIEALLGTVEKALPYAETLESHYPGIVKCLKVIQNKDNKNTPADICLALTQFATLLKKDTQITDPEYDAVVAELKAFADPSSALSTYLNENLEDIKNILRTMTRAHWSQGQKFFKEEKDQKQALFIPELEEWAEKMKTERIKLNNSLHKEGEYASVSKDGVSLKKYSFFYKQIQDVKKISSLQLKEVSKEEKLEQAFGNFLSDQISQPMKQNEESIKKIGNLLLQYKAEVKEADEKIAAQIDRIEYLTNNGRDTELSESNLASFKNDKQILEKREKAAIRGWNTLEKIFPEIEKEKSGSKTYQSKSLIPLEEIMEACVHSKNFAAKVSDQILFFHIGINLVMVEDEISKDPNDYQIEGQTPDDKCRKIKEVCTKFINQIEIVETEINGLSVEVKDTSEFHWDDSSDPVSSVEILEQLNHWKEIYLTNKDSAQVQMTINADRRAAVERKRVEEREAAIELQKQLSYLSFTDDLLASGFERVEVNDNVLAACTVALGLPAGENLKKSIYQYIADNEDWYKPSINKFLKGDIAAYVRNTSDIDAERSLSTVPAVLHQTYQENRAAYKSAPKKADFITELNQCIEDNDDFFGAYINGMRDDDDIPIKLEETLAVLSLRLRTRIVLHGPTYPSNQKVIVDSRAEKVEGKGFSKEIHLLQSYDGEHFDCLIRKSPTILVPARMPFKKKGS